MLHQHYSAKAEPNRVEWGVMPKKKTTAKRRKTTSKKSTAKTTSKPNKRFFLASKINKSPIAIKNSKRIIAISVVLFIVVLFAAWWQFIFADPNKVLSDMLVNNLRTPGVVKNVQQGSGQNVIVQNTYLSFIDGPKSQTKTTLDQAASSGERNRVVTENIGTANTDYIRYRAIDISSGSGQTDTSVAENIWASRSADEGTQQTNFLNEGLFGVVPFGNFEKNQVNLLRDMIDKNEIYKYTSLDRKFENGRVIYKYEIEFLPSNLVEYLAEYAKLIGVDAKNQLNPESYVGAQPVMITIKVDLFSRELKSIEYSDTGRVEEYSSFGLKRMIEIPSETISITELQQRLQLSQ